MPPTDLNASVISGRRLRTARENAGLSLRKLAAAAGYPNAHTFLWRLEAEAAITASPEFARAVARSVAVPVHDLFEIHTSTRLAS